ncbi:MAG: AMP-binding protein [Clostridia bacterium]|nr:AMP-binding protein [Clostridia bacterium]
MKLENVPTIRDLLDVAPMKHNDRTFFKYIRDGEIIEKKFSEVRSDGLAFCRKIRHELPERTHIAIISKSTYEYIVCMTGVLVGSHVAVPIDPDSTAEEAAEIINDSDATAILYGAEFSDRIDAVKALCPKIKFQMVISYSDEFNKIYEEYSEAFAYAALSDIKMDPDACALIIYTSGTTGDKKGVMLSSEALVSNLIFEPYSDIVVRVDTILSVLPLHHIFCFICGFVGPLNVGNCVCLNGEMRDLFKNLLIFKPNQIRVVPMIAQAILGRIRAIQAKNPALSPKEAAAQVTGGNLDMMLSGGAHLDASLCKAFEEYGIFLRQGYGMSEASGKVTIPDLDCPINSTGRLMSTVNARVVGGEIQLDTPGLMLGYYKRPEETAEVITEDGWLRTGDIGYIDENGLLFITGRLKNLIILANGENVSPEGIENKYKENKLVSEVLVYAEKDVIVAEVYPNTEYAEIAGITDINAVLEELTDSFNETALPSHRVERLIVREIPFEKTSTGKIKRNGNDNARGEA